MTNLWIKSTRNQKPKGKTKTFLIGKELKTKDLLQTAELRARVTATKPRPGTPEADENQKDGMPERRLPSLYGRPFLGPNRAA